MFKDSITIESLVKADVWLFYRLLGVKFNQVYHFIIL